ncbi:MAG: tail fiber domain-containing protein [Phycisphaerae bacterium]|nr:tail fiber domain-containing protein [Saprospiraceae bacterium]
MKLLTHAAFSLALLFFTTKLPGQNVVISDDPAAIPNSSAMLDVQSVNINKGVLFPRMDNTAMNGISNPAVGLLVFNTDTESFWYRTTSAWTNLSSVITVDNTLTGDGSVADPFGLAQNSATDGQTLTWNDAATAWVPSTGPWLTSGSNIVYTNRNVGIGMSDPQAPLHVKSDIIAEENTLGDKGGLLMLDKNRKERVYLNHIYSPSETRLRVEVYVPDTITGIAKVQFFKNTDALTKLVEFFQGSDYGTAVSAAIGVDQEDSYFQIHGGNLGIGVNNPDAKLHVRGNFHTDFDAKIDGDLSVLQDVSIGGSLDVNGTNYPSDIRYKKDLRPLQYALDKVLQIKGLHYNWKIEDYPGKHFTTDLQLGVIAQDVAKVYPELVSTDKNGYLSVDYSRFSPILIEAIREQQEIIEKQQKQMDLLSAQMAMMQKLMTDVLDASSSKVASSAKTNNTIKE